MDNRNALSTFSWVNSGNEVARPFRNETVSVGSDGCSGLCVCARAILWEIIKIVN